MIMRRSRAGFSALYGAYGVILVSTLVIGVALSASHGPGPDLERERALARHFLATLLASSVGNATTVEQAVAHACFERNCSAAAWNASSLNATIASLAAPLAHALDRSYILAVTAAGFTVLRSGSLEPRSGQGSASAEIYRPSDRGFAGLALQLGPL